MVITTQVTKIQGYNKNPTTDAERLHQQGNDEADRLAVQGAAQHKLTKTKIKEYLT